MADVTNLGENARDIGGAAGVLRAMDKLATLGGMHVGYRRGDGVEYRRGIGVEYRRGDGVGYRRGMEWGIGGGWSGV